MINKRTYQIAQFDLGLPNNFFMEPILILYSLYRANNKGEDQTAWSVCPFVVRMQLSHVFSHHALPVLSKCIFCYKCVSDKIK